MASVAKQIGAQESGVYGTAPVAYDIQHAAGDDLGRVLPVVVIVILLLSGVFLRSLVAPIMLLIMVGLSYVSVLGLTNIIFVHIGGRSGVNFALPLLLFVVLFALGAGDTIVVLHEIRQETLRYGPDADKPNPSAVIGTGAIGGTVTAAGIVLAGGFAVMGVAGGNTQFEELGIALALGILLTTCIVSAILVTSLVHLLGRWTWWPSPLADVQHANRSKHQ
jgi:RND superfamily putative drug exporter